MFRYNFVSREPADSLHSVGNQFRFSFLFLKTFFNVDLFFFFFLGFIGFVTLFLMGFFFFFKCFVLARRPVES